MGHASAFSSLHASGDPRRTREVQRERREFFERLFDVFTICAQLERGCERRFVGRVDAGERWDLAGPGTLVELLRIAAFALGERGVDEDLGEGDAAGLAAVDDVLAVVAEGGNERSDDDRACFSEQERGFGGAADVFLAVGVAETEPAAQAGAEDIAVEHYR